MIEYASHITDYALACSNQVSPTLHSSKQAKTTKPPTQHKPVTFVAQSITPATPKVNTPRRALSERNTSTELVRGSKLSTPYPARPAATTNTKPLTHSQSLSYTELPEVHDIIEAARKACVGSFSPYRSKPQPQPRDPPKARSSFWHRGVKQRMQVFEDIPEQLVPRHVPVTSEKVYDVIAVQPVAAVDTAPAEIACEAVGSPVSRLPEPCTPKYVPLAPPATLSKTPRVDRLLEQSFVRVVSVQALQDSHATSTALASDLVARLRAAAAACAAPLPTTSDVLHTLRSHNQRLQDEVDAMQARIEHMQRAVNTCEQQLREAASTKDSLTHTVDSLNDENDQLVDMIELIEAEKQSLEDRVAALSHRATPRRDDVMQAAARLLAERFPAELAQLAQHPEQLDDVLRSCCQKLRQSHPSPTVELNLDDIITEAEDVAGRGTMHCIVESTHT